MLRATLLIIAVLSVAGSAGAAAREVAPTAAQTVAAARTLGVGAEAQRLRGRFLPGARLVRDGGAARRRGATHIGGSPDLPAGTRWPSCNGHPLALLEQVDLAELAAAVPGQTRGRGTLAIFAGLGTDEAGDFDLLSVEGGPLKTGGCVAVIHMPPGRRLVARRTPRRTKTLPRTSVRLRPTLTVPDWEVAERLLGQDIKGKAFDNWERLVDRAAAGDLVHPAPDRPLHQLLGWAQPLQQDPTVFGPSCHHATSRLLAQFDSAPPFDIDDTDGGWLLLTLPAADLRAGRFDRICAEHQLG